MKNLHLNGNASIWHKQLSDNRYIIWYRDLNRIELIKVNSDDTITTLKQQVFEPDITIKEFASIIEQFSK